MNDFIKLRQLAKERRAKMIAEAEAEYNSTIIQISNLELTLCGTNRVRHPKVNAAIESVIPSDRTFTTDDILASLQALDPSRVWRKRLIYGHIQTLREKGIIKRLEKANGRALSVYVRADITDQPAHRGLPEVLAGVVTKPMTVTEIAVAAIEAGYRSRMTPRNFRSQVKRVLRDGGYRPDGERWNKGQTRD
jgi:hypothetical protein